TRSRTEQRAKCFQYTARGDFGASCPRVSAAEGFLPEQGEELGGGSGGNPMGGEVGEGGEAVAVDTQPDLLAIRSAKADRARGFGEAHPRDAVPGKVDRVDQPPLPVDPLLGKADAHQEDLVNPEEAKERGEPEDRS